MKVGILGSGMVGQALAKGFADLGNEVCIGSREGKEVEGWDGKVGKFEEVAEQAELVVLCVKGNAAEEVVRGIAESLKGKTIIDTTNPIGEAPVDGVIQFFTEANESLMSRLQKIVPEAHFVKAFNSVGAAAMVKPDFAGEKPTMFICGDNEEAKTQVKEILKDFGWESENLGKIAAASPIEQLCILWCIPGMLKNDWYHAYKLLKK